MFFLHEKFQEYVYIVIPPSVKHAKPNQFFKLVKSLYGLKQNIRKWHEKITSFHSHHRYKQDNSYASLFTKQD